MPNKNLLVIGASNGGQMMTAIFEEQHLFFTNVSFIDDNKSLWGTEVCGKKVLSVGTDELKNVIKDYDYAFIGVALHKLMPFRRRMLDVLKGNIPLMNIIHKSAYISETATVGEGNYISAFSYVGPYSKIGDSNFFSANTIIEHHSSVGDLNSWGPSNTTSGMCHIGDCVCFGTKISMVFSVNIGSHSIIASDVVINKNIPATSVVRKVNYPDFSISINKRNM